MLTNWLVGVVQVGLKRQMTTLQERLRVNSSKFAILYIMRLFSTSFIRLTVELGVFALVLVGVSISALSDNAVGDGSESLVLVVLLSRIGPLAFSLYSSASVLGYGSYAERVYLSGKQR